MLSANRGGIGYDGYGFPMNELYGDCCGYIAAEYDPNRPVDRLDHVELKCMSCGALGHFSVDADEDGAWVTWVVNELGPHQEVT